MKKYLLLVLSLFFCFSFLNAQSALEKAEKSFNEGLFNQAIEEYSPLLKSKKQQERYEAQLKTILAYKNLYKYDKALETIYSYPVPKDKLFKMRYYLLQAQLLNRTLHTYQSPDLVESKNNPTKWTAGQKKEAIKDIYQKLWDMRSELILIPAEQEKAYLTLNSYTSINNELTPSVYDYLVDTWQEQNIVKQNKLLEESYTLEGSLRAAVRELYKLQRIMLFKTDKNQLQFSKCLDDIAGHANFCSVESVKPYLFRANYPLAKAKALLESAKILSSAEENLQAVQRLDICLSLENNYWTDSCRYDKENLTRPVFYLTKTLPQDIAPRQEYTITYQAANIDKIKVYIYKLNAQTLYKNGNYVDSKTKDSLKKTSPVKAFAINPAYTQKYQKIKADYKLAALEPGFYYVVFADSAKEENLLNDNFASYIVNASDLALVETSYNTTNHLYALENKGSYAQFYALNAKTGAPISDVKIETNLSDSAISTNKIGQAKIKIAQGLYNKKALGKYGNNYALLNNLQLADKKATKVSYTLNTDSAIYKPGQEVKMQIIAAFDEDSTWKSLTNRTLEAKLIAPNGKEFEKQKITLDSFGSANTYFVLPKEAMLGTWTLNVSYNKSYATSASFSVEEYKQPEFEITFENYKGTPTFNTPLTISGNALYFRGDAVTKAKVAYQITKSYYRPWFWWWMPVRNDRENALEGTTYTDDAGTFYITWTPEEKDKENILPARYEVKVFITDQAGNTIQASKSYTISKQKYFFAIKREKGFFTTEEQNTLSVQMLNAQEEALQGKAKASLSKLELKNDQESFNLDKQDNFVEKQTIKTFEVSFDKDKTSKIILPQLEEGFYRLKLTKDKDEGKLNFLVVNVKDTKLNLPSVALAQEESYAPGETALILLGNSNTKAKYIEFFKQDFLIEQQTLNKNGIVILQLPIKSSYSGGIYLRWFAVADYKAYSEVVNIPVIYPNTKITAQITGKDKLEPGAKAELSLTAVDEHNIPLEARAVISVYDKALDYYKKHNLKLPIVYDSNKFGQALFTSNFGYNNHFMPRTYGLLRSAAGASNGIKALAMAKAPDIDGADDMLMSTEAALETSVSLDEETTADITNQEDSKLSRKDFATTAYWNPALDIKQGKGTISFKLPDSLTRWQVLAALWTKNLKTGKADFAITSTKDLFLTLQTPRFLREGDKIELTTMAVNNTDKVLEAKISLFINLNGQDAQDLFKLNKKEQSFFLEPNGQKVLTWTLQAPNGTGAITINAVARAGSFVDGEERVLPLLPSKQRLVENNTIALKAGINKLSLENLLKDKTLELETAQLSIEPSLIMPVLNAMPLLVEYKNPTFISKLANYYPLAVLNKLYQTYPELKAQAAKLPKRDTINATWQTEENIFINQLETSPWLNLSKGYKEQNAIDIFDASLVNKKQRDLTRELALYQNKDGSFAWIKGGEGNIYMTLSYLEKAAMAKAWGINIDEQITKKALAFATKEIKLNLAKPSRENLSQALYLAVILTSFPKDWYNYDVKTLMERTNNFINKMTPLGKAHAALAWARLGNKTRAQNIFTSLMDCAQTSSITGIYWAPEAKSWQWFNDSITLHSAAIKALLELNPQDTRLKGLTKWLIFQKGATLWDTPEEAATAVLTIFEVMKKTSALEQTKVFDITWNNQNTTLEAKPFDIDEDKFTFTAYNEQATPKSLSAVIIKAKDSGLDDFASLTALYSSSKLQEESPEGLLNIKKEYYLITDKKAILLKEGDEVEIGSEIQVRLTISTQNPFDFVSITDFKPAAFENQDLLSSWKYQNRLSYYQEMQNSQTNFYFSYLPNGIYELKYTLRPTTAGIYYAGAAVIQSQFAPKFGAHSAGFYFKVK